MCIRFKETDVRATGRTSMGVIGMNVDEDDEIIGMQIDADGETLIFASEKGMGKRTEISEFNVQNRGGKGVKCYNITEKTGELVGFKAVNEDNELMMITTEGIIIQIRISDVNILKRITSGVKLINLDEGVKVAQVALVKREFESQDECLEDTDVEVNEVSETELES
jgi:DNA gyrase subunit A